jgi:hypothetical protein
MQLLNMRSSWWLVPVVSPATRTGSASLLIDRSHQLLHLQHADEPLQLLHSPASAEKGVQQQGQSLYLVEALNWAIGQ